MCLIWSIRHALPKELVSLQAAAPDLVNRARMLLCISPRWWIRKFLADLIAGAQLIAPAAPD
jgi:hypothetical protein